MIYEVKCLMDKWKRYIANDKASINVAYELWDYEHIEEPYRVKVTLYVNKPAPKTKFTGSLREANAWIEAKFVRREILFRNFRG